MNSNFCVLDLEATCDDKGTVSRDDMEIIEIGALAFNEELKVIGVYESFIKPQISPILTPFCTELTTITQEQVDNANTIDIVFKEFNEWLNLNSITKWGSWGMYDKNQFVKDANRFNIYNPMDNRYHINIKDRFSKVNNMKKQVGLGKACRIKNLEFQGTAHRALSDTNNIFNIIKNDINLASNLLK